MGKRKRVVVRKGEHEFQLNSNFNVLLMAVEVYFVENLTFWTFILASFFWDLI